MNPAIPALPVLAYIGPAVEEQSSLLRTGRVFGWAAAALALLFVPIWCVHLGWLEARPTIPDGYAEFCARAVPLIQAFLVGVGLSLTIVGRRLSGGHRGRKYLLAVAMNLVAAALMAAELKVPTDPPVRWVALNCPM